MAVLKRLLIDGYGVKVSVSKGLLVISNGNGGKKKIGLADIDQVIIATSGVVITSSAVRLLMRNGVDLVFLGPRGLPIGRVYPPYINKTVDTRRAQYLLYNDDKRSLELVKNILYSKVYNQAGHLRRLARHLDRPGLRDVAYDLMSDYLEEAGTVHGSLEASREKLRIAEALAAHKYWETLATTIPENLGFTGRKPGEGSDVVNRCLDYMYSLLYSEAWRSLVLAGLDPYAGYMHTDKSGKPVLVYDYSEMFRASLVDYPLFSRLRNGWIPEWKDREAGLLSPSTRRELVRIFTENLEKKAGARGADSRKKLGSHLQWYAYELASYVRGEKREYKGFQMEW